MIYESLDDEELAETKDGAQPPSQGISNTTNAINNINHVPSNPITSIYFPLLDPEDAEEQDRLARIEEKLEVELAPGRKAKSQRSQLLMGGAIIMALFFLLIAVVIYYVRKSWLNDLERDDPYCDFYGNFCNESKLLINTNATMFNCTSIKTMERWCRWNFDIKYWKIAGGVVAIFSCGVGLPYICYYAYSKKLRNKGLGSVAQKFVTNEEFKTELKQIQLAELTLATTHADLPLSTTLADLPLGATIEMVDEAKTALEEKIKSKKEIREAYANRFFKIVTKEDITVLKNQDIGRIVLQYLDMAAVSNEGATESKSIGIKNNRM